MTVEASVANSVVGVQAYPYMLNLVLQSSRECSLVMSL